MAAFSNFFGSSITRRLIDRRGFLIESSGVVVEWLGKDLNMLLKYQETQTSQAISRQRC
jgi:hypothetical protein